MELYKLRLLISRGEEGVVVIKVVVLGRAHAGL